MGYSYCFGCSMSHGIGYLVVGVLHAMYSMLCLCCLYHSYCLGYSMSHSECFIMWGSRAGGSTSHGLWFGYFEISFTALCGLVG